METEDVLFRTRMLWGAINSAGTVNPGERADFLHASEEEAKLVLGLLGTDSKGGYDSTMVNESPMLGLSNTLSAIQAVQLKAAIPRCLTRLFWLASDWNLSDCMTKKKEECRKSVEFFLNCRDGMLKFDPSFIQSARKERATKGTPIQQLQGLQTKNSQKLWGDAIHSELSHLCAVDCVLTCFCPWAQPTRCATRWKWVACDRVVRWLSVSLGGRFVLCISVYHSLFGTSNI